MPFFPEGQDPLAAPPPGQGAAPALERAPIGQAAPDPFAAPSMAQTVDAAFRQSNPIVSVFRALSAASPDTTYDPNYNVLDDIKGTKYETDYASEFTSSPNAATTQALKARIDQEEADRQTLSASGWAGTVASIGAGLVDPTLYLPFVGEAEAGLGLGRSVARMATLGALQSTASEVALQASQVTRTPGESLGNIASGTILMGILGGAGAMLSRGEATAAAEGLDAVRQDFSPATNAQPDASAPANENVPTVGLAQAAGAAASDTRQLKLKPFLPGDVSKLPVIGPALNQVGGVLNRMSPTLRVFTSDIVPAKRAMADLAETPFVFEDNAKGVPTAFGAPPIDRLVKTQSRQMQMASNDALHDAFSDYRYGPNPPSFPLQRSVAEDLAGQSGGKMSYGDFKAQVSQALWSGDTHAIPQVQQAAQRLRQSVFDPIKEAAQRTLGPDGKPMLGEALEAPAGDRSFFPRSWNKDAIAARRNQFKSTLTDWLVSEQGQKAATKERLSGLQQQLEETRESVGRLEDPVEIAAAQARHDGIRSRIEAEVENWHGASSAEAKAALKARGVSEGERAEKQAAGAYQGKGERLKSADMPVDRAVKHILESDRDLSREELGNRADEIADRILGSPDGRLPYDIASGGPAMGPPGEHQPLRGSLNARDFAIPTSMVKDFVEKDTEHAVAAFLRTTLPDIMLTQRFGDAEMTDVFRRVNEAFAAKASGLEGESALRKLESQRQGMIRDLAATRDRVRGIYGWSPDPRLRQAARAANVFRNWNLIADLGTSVFNRLQDAAGAVGRYGFMNVFRDAYSPFFKGMLGLSDLPKAARVQAKAMATAVDGAMGHMRSQFGDVIDNYRPGSKFERGLAWAADKSMLVNLHGPWTDWMKTMATSAASAEFLRTAERIGAGSGSAKDITRMAAASIDRPMAERIWKAYSNGGGQKIDGVHVPNTGDWEDRGARQAFEAAMGREADIVVLTPGAEKPLWMSSPVASLLGQFKSFVAAAHERLLLANLQQRDVHTLEGFLTLMASGMLSYRLYTWLSGAPASDRPQDWVKEAMSRSAILGWFTELNQMQSKFTGGSTDAFRLIGADHPLSRLQTASALSELLGPTYSHLEGLTQSIGDASRGTWNAGDTHRIREWVFLQNLFAVRRLLDQAEDGINNSFGVKPRNRNAGPPMLMQ